MLDYHLSIREWSVLDIVNANENGIKAVKVAQAQGMKLEKAKKYLKALKRMHYIHEKEGKFFPK